MKIDKQLKEVYWTLILLSLLGVLVICILFYIVHFHSYYLR